MATNNKLNELLENGIGTHKDYDPRIHVHYGVNLFKYAAGHVGLIMIEANAKGLYTTPPCHWVARNQPELMHTFLPVTAHLDHSGRKAILGSVYDSGIYRYNPKTVVAHGVFSYGHGKPPKGKSNYSWRHWKSIIMNAAALAKDKGLKKIFLTRIYGGNGGVLFSTVLADAARALGDLDIELHFFVPQDPDQGKVGE